MGLPFSGEAGLERVEGFALVSVRLEKLFSYIPLGSQI